MFINNRDACSATGGYYTWIADDNSYKPEAIEKLARELNNDPKLVMVYSDYTNIDTNVQIIDEGKLLDSEYIVTGNVCGACFLYTAKAAEEVGEYDANLFLAEDYDYWMRMARVGKINYVKDNLYLYRRHTESVTEIKKNLIDVQTYKAIEKFLYLYTGAKKYNLQFDLFDHILRRVPDDFLMLQRICFFVNNYYKIYLLIRKIRVMIKNNSFWKVLRRSKMYLVE